MKLSQHTFWFIICWLGGFLLANLIVTPLTAILGVPDFPALIEQIKKGEQLTHINTIKIIQIVGHLCIHTIPTIIFAKFLMRQSLWKYLYLNSKFKPVNIPIIILLFIGIYPFAIWIYYLNMLLIPDDWIAANTLQIQMRLMQMNTPIDLILNLLMLGVVAGLGEELIFRGCLQRLAATYFQNLHVAVWITGLIFSLIHFQPEGLIPRFLLGVLLGYVFVWTGSLWASIIGHITFNSAQVLMYYSVTSVNMENDPTKMPEISFIYGLISLLILIFACFGLILLNRDYGLNNAENYRQLPDSAKLPF